ncbi:hypothetical protein TSUD_222970 [Trifolium subterraneum]|uniref:SWIB domain-containing protein n=1 Tax=Trifolium subterraneum TaxID=3900 RepID=A0A2Z6P9Q8_TRISU|nr:hypothetical protein TSUD_222970 [Trifolium subterraneum]
MAPSRVFGAFAGRALMAAAAKSATKKAAASAEASSKTAVKKTVKRTVSVKSTGGIQKVVPVTSELGSFIGSPEVSRTEAVKKVWDYIKLQNLQYFVLDAEQVRTLKPLHRWVMFELCYQYFVLDAVGNSAFIAVRPHPPNCGIWVAFIAASNTIIVLGVKGWI